MNAKGSAAPAGMVGTTTTGTTGTAASATTVVRGGRRLADALLAEDLTHVLSPVRGGADPAGAAPLPPLTTPLRSGLRSFDDPLVSPEAATPSFRRSLFALRVPRCQARCTLILPCRIPATTQASVGVMPPGNASGSSLAVVPGLQQRAFSSQGASSSLPATLLASMRASRVPSTPLLDRAHVVHAFFFF
jgi:hypothetical protein